MHLHTVSLLNILVLTALWLTSMFVPPHQHQLVNLSLQLLGLSPLLLWPKLHVWGILERILPLTWPLLRLRLLLRAPLFLCPQCPPAMLLWPRWMLVVPRLVARCPRLWSATA